MNNFFNNLKFNKLSYLLEIIELRDIRQKIKAYNKIRKMDLTEDMGHLILDKIDLLKEENYSDINIIISLISLVFKNYYPSYSNKIIKLYKNFTLENKKELLSILSITEDDNVITLYKDLVSKNYKELDNIPIGTLSTNKGNYALLFPDLYKALKLDVDKNNLIVLLNDFVNAGVVPIEHIKKNKKLIQTNLINIFKEGLKYKYKDEFFMSDKEYINLRIFVEAAISLEYYVSCKETKSYLEKLLKKKDNQLKLFILDNYVRKNKSISKINFNLIAKDILSRYPLYSFLVFNKLEKLMPKKYNELVSLAESDLAINFSIFNSYALTPYDFEYIEERIINNSKYLIFKFKTKFNYNEEIVDPATDYLLKNVNLDETLIKDGETVYLGISGGYNPDSDIYLIDKPLKELKVSKYDEKDYEKIVNSLLASLKKKDIKEKEENKDELKKEKKKVKEDKKALKKIKEELTKVEEEIHNVDDSNIEVKENYFDNVENQNIEKKKHPILRAIFSFNTFLTLICLSFAGAVIVLYLYINNVDLFNIMKGRKQYSIVNEYKENTLKTKDKFKEIAYTDVFSQGEPDYYVLFFNKKDKSVYYPFIDRFLRSGYTIYYVNKGKDNISFENNGTVFTVTTDTFFRVTEGEYNFYIVDKTNILKEFKIYENEIEEKEAEEARKTAEEQAKKEKEAKKEAKEKSKIHEMAEAPVEKRS